MSYQVISAGCKKIPYPGNTRQPRKLLAGFEIKFPLVNRVYQVMFPVNDPKIGLPGDPFKAFDRDTGIPYLQEVIDYGFLIYAENKAVQKAG